VSTPLALAAVSAALRNLIDAGFVEANLAGAIGSSVSVSAVAPDLVDTESSDALPQLNIFLFHASHNADWRNAALPSRDPQGRRASNAPLALDLHYLVTAYARTDAAAEMLLGHAMFVLHEMPRLNAAALRRLLGPLSLPPALVALADTGLADQAEVLRINPMPMSFDDVSKLWSAIKADYRPTAAYQVTVALIQGTRATLAALPVLSRGSEPDPATGADRGVIVNPDLLPPLPTLLAVPPPPGRSAARLGDTLTVTGIRLAGAGHVARLSHRLLTTPLELPAAVNVNGTACDIVLPNDVAAQSDLAPGVWSLSLRLVPAGAADEIETNAVALLLAAAPVFVDTGPPLNLPAAVAVRGGVPPRVTVTLRSRPRVRLEQRAQLMLDGSMAEAQARADAADPLVFRFPNSVPAGNRRVRLRVDGIESPLVLTSGPAPVFDAAQQIVVPA
jgi:Pvc16 N-terminal domain